MRETTRHRKIYNRYVDLGSSRSIEALHQLLAADGSAPALRTLYEWSRAHNWQQRIDDLEREARSADAEIHFQAIKEMRERHIQEALLLQQKGAQKYSGLNPDEMTPEVATRAIVEGQKLERLARGEATERAETMSQTDERLRRVEDDELEHLIELAKESATREESSQSD